MSVKERAEKDACGYFADCAIKIEVSHYMEWSRTVSVCRVYILHEGQHIYSETLGAQSRVKKSLQYVDAQEDTRGSHKESREVQRGHTRNTEGERSKYTEAAVL